MPVTEGTNLNPLPIGAPAHVKSEVGISSSAYDELHLNEGLLLSTLKSPLSSGTSDQAHEETSSL